MTACPHCRRPLGVVESVAVSPRDPRAEPVAAATAARVGAERADEAATAALARIDVQQRRRRESGTVAAAREGEP